MSEAEFIPTGQYYIRSSEDVFAGRNKAEDFSLHPKRVLCPTDHPSNPDLWKIERLPNGYYKLYARGDPVGTMDNLLYAFLTDQDKKGADEWIITKQQAPGHRPLYIIMNTNGLGWVKSTNIENPQVAVRHLLMNPSNPPIFPPNQLWNIQPLVD